MAIVMASFCFSFGGIFKWEGLQRQCSYIDINVPNLLTNKFKTAILSRNSICEFLLLPSYALFLLHPYP